MPHQASPFVAGAPWGDPQQRKERPQMTKSPKTFTVHIKVAALYEFEITAPNSAEARRTAILEFNDNLNDHQIDEEITSVTALQQQP